MAKKEVKKKEENVSDFDKMSIEVKEAVTAVLMLNSKENEVLAKSCESLFKFASKSIEARRTLNDLNCIPTLLNLLNSEDLTVKRNACMVIGTLSQYVDVKQKLLYSKKYVNVFVNLISSDESKLIQEFSTLTLCNLASDSCCRVWIAESSGLDALNNCVTSSDPDIQKNSVETLLKILEDFKVKKLLKKANIFPNIFPLFSSEYPVIQRLALSCIALASDDSENRATLRELGCSKILLNLLTNPKYTDLQPYVLSAIAVILEDPQMAQEIKEEGGVTTLLSILSDTEIEQAAVDAKRDKKSPKQKKGKEAKTSKVSSAKGRQKPSETVIIPMAPDVKVQLLKSLAALAKHEEHRKLLYECEIEKVLIKLLTNESQLIQYAALEGLVNMAGNIVSRVRIGKIDGISPIIKLMTSDNSDNRESASQVIAIVTMDNKPNCKEVASSYETILRGLRDSKLVVVTNCLNILINLVVSGYVSPSNAGRSSVDGILNLLRKSALNNFKAKSMACLAISTFAVDSDAQSKFTKSRVLKELIPLLESKFECVRTNAAWSIVILSSKSYVAENLSEMGVLGVLHNVLTSTSLTNKFALAAYNSILDSNLIAKFAYENVLDFTNIVEDSFLDVGKLKEGEYILRIDSYCKLEVSEKLPHVLFSFNSRKSESQLSDVDEELSGDDVNTTEIRTESAISKESTQLFLEDSGKPSKSDSSNSPLKESLVEPLERLSECTWDPMNDGILITYLKEAYDLVSSAEDDRSRVTRLAGLVSRVLGGQITDIDQISYEWEIHFAELRDKYQSMVIPIGLIKKGFYVHRAMLFKVLADRLSIPCTLYRGSYGRGWNTVSVSTDEKRKEYIINLMTDVGQLIEVDSPDSEKYTMLY